MGASLWIRIVLAQLVAAGLVALALKAGLLTGMGTATPALAGLVGLLALGLSWAWRLPVWWRWIQGGFVPALAAAAWLHAPPWVWLAGFALLWLVFRGAPRERVPLYLSNSDTWDALAGLLPKKRAFALVDLGCGLGGGLAGLARRFPNGAFQGVESAPLPCLWAWLRARGRANLHIRWGDLWSEDLGRYDVVYAFLSPEPMPELWLKARREMRTGSLLVSNSFEVPGWVPDHVLTLDDARRTRLLIWRM